MRAWLAAASLFASIFVLFIYSPLTNPFESERAFAEQVHEVSGASQIAVYGDIPENTLFYADRAFVSLDDGALRGYPIANGDEESLLARASDRDKIDASCGRSLDSEIVLRNNSHDGGRYVLIRISGK
jgi:hypothetical protein